MNVDCNETTFNKTNLYTWKNIEPGDTALLNRAAAILKHSSPEMYQNITGLTIKTWLQQSTSQTPYLLRGGYTDGNTGNPGFLRVVYAFSYTDGNEISQGQHYDHQKHRRGVIGGESRGFDMVGFVKNALEEIQGDFTLRANGFLNKEGGHNQTEAKFQNMQPIRSGRQRSMVGLMFQLIASNAVGSKLTLEKQIASSPIVWTLTIKE